MINELVFSSGDMWKFVDDTTVDELVSKYRKSRIQITVNDLLTQISELKFQLNEKKCKELRIGYGKPSAEFDPVVVNDISPETAEKGGGVALALPIIFL